MRFSDEFGFYELNPFPGCNQIVVSNHAFIYPEYRGKGYGQVQHEARLEKARELGYDLILCTVNSKNLAEIHILRKYGWVEHHDSRFVNSETSNTIQVWAKRLIHHHV